MTEGDIRALHPTLYESVAFECGPGWFGILADLARKAPKGARVVQVKEKFGRLTIYTGAEPGVVMGTLIAGAEYASMRVCESCGEPGELRLRGGLSLTRCDWCMDRGE